MSLTNSEFNASARMGSFQNIAIGEKFTLDLIHSDASMPHGFFYNPRGFAITKNHLFIHDSYNRRLQIFRRKSKLNLRLDFNNSGSCKKK